jgi:putative membrane protein
MGRELSDNKSYLKIIYIVSALIPIVVAFLILFPAKLSFAGDWVKMLPAVHAGINSITVVVLIAALVAIKNGKVALHRACMMSALFLGVLFLVSYILYHSSVESVKFGDLNHDGIVDLNELETAGSTRIAYLVLLASHIILSILVVPFVLLAFYYALTDQLTKHRKMVRFTYPVWMYVSITGVLVYFMIEPYYL